MAQVISVTASRDNLNPAAMADTIENLVSTKYYGTDWVRQGPNFISNKATGQSINLNAEATAILEDAPLRQDAVVVVQNDAGGHEVIHVAEDAVKAAGNDFETLRQQINATLPQGMSLSVKLLLGAAALGGLYWALKR